MNDLTKEAVKNIKHLLDNFPKITKHPSKWTKNDLELHSEILKVREDMQNMIDGKENSWGNSLLSISRYYERRHMQLSMQVEELENKNIINNSEEFHLEAGSHKEIFNKK